MTLANIATKTIVSCNGVSYNFTYGFWIDSQIDANLTQIDQYGNEYLIPQSLWKLTPNADPTTGGVFQCPLISGGGGPLAVGYKLCLSRNFPIQQTTSLENQSAYYPQSIEQQLDYITALIQQVAEVVSRAIVLPIGDGSNVVLPGPPSRVNKKLGFDANGVLTLLS